jgi:hypothetical protein
MEAHTNIVVHVDVALVHVMHHGNVDVVHGAVVIEMARIPVSTLVAGAYVPKAIVNAAIEADVRSPIATEEAIVVVCIAPVAGCPKRSRIRCLNPNAWHPVVAR